MRYDRQGVGTGNQGYEECYHLQGRLTVTYQVHHLSVWDSVYHSHQQTQTQTQTFIHIINRL
jgi:hypothetical protein